MADRTPAPAPDPTPPAPAADTAKKTVVLATQDRLTRFVVPNPDGDDVVVDHNGVRLSPERADEVTTQASRYGVPLVDITEYVERVDALKLVAIANSKKD